MFIDTSLSTPTVSAVEDAFAAVAERAHAERLQCVRTGIVATATATAITASTSANTTGSVIGAADGDLRSVIVVRGGTGHVTRDI